MDISLPAKNSSDRIRVRKIFCMAMNYKSHIEEIEISKPEAPTIFMKPDTAIIGNGGIAVLPKESHNVHYEVEMVGVIRKNGKNIELKNAGDYIYGYALGLDLTLRDIQMKAIKIGHPWSIAKGFDTSAPISEIIPKDAIDDPYNLELRLWLNGELKQDGNTGNMIFKLEEIISYLSRFFTLERGDLIYTGTPSGVGQIKSGDNIRAQLSDLLTLEIWVQ
jgi:2-keto-4-pentenoate hydratase/2-oxohepta-3-ene-1,7-dioic acid hydratase in catechol pathway